ncbi:unnamed protein product [Protopolystoma xenopodis]|uniref:Helicase C-terminal domain-containing protein n=1 Tax=Protopolystoma xenopodis TaxID=117903 RepID=A0A3S5B113_9PLAT|nr:unnamed protein product [Protopolystoma xenopodis]
MAILRASYHTPDLKDPAELATSERRVYLLIGRMKQPDRRKALAEFASTDNQPYAPSTQILVATDVASR